MHDTWDEFWESVKSVLLMAGVAVAIAFGPPLIAYVVALAQGMGARMSLVMSGVTLAVSAGLTLLVLSSYRRAQDHARTESLVSLGAEVAGVTAESVAKGMGRGLGELGRGYSEIQKTYRVEAEADKAWAAQRAKVWQMEEKRRIEDRNRHEQDYIRQMNDHGHMLVDSQHGQGDAVDADGSDDFVFPEGL